MGRHGIEANGIFLQEEELERLQEQQQQQQQQEEEDQKMEVDPETGDVIVTTGGHVVPVQKERGVQPVQHS